MSIHFKFINSPQWNCCCKCCEVRQYTAGYHRILDKDGGIIIDQPSQPKPRHPDKEKFEEFVLDQTIQQDPECMVKLELPMNCGRAVSIAMRLHLY